MSSTSTLPAGTYFYSDRFDGMYVLVENGREVGRVATRKAARAWYVSKTTGAAHGS